MPGVECTGRRSYTSGMSDPRTKTLLRPVAPTAPEPPLYPLESGDRLTRAEFERRYEAMPHLKKAELIEGVVYVGSPVRFTQHGRPDSDIQTWLGTYRIATPGVDSGGNSTLRLDLDNEPQPDVL